eukprot:TRINITY_DN901_c5_g1_i1.p1 TRINITY_DN901_c5_g1~~TRINITY_DN901_c5_g1_i1.p1  ORF type:complete len:2310 (-),score=653.86 TRINITY_DN901_c5_g1_i1:290-7219(-)
MRGADKGSRSKLGAVRKSSVNAANPSAASSTSNSSAPRQSKASTGSAGNGFGSSILGGSGTGGDDPSIKEGVDDAWEVTWDDLGTTSGNRGSGARATTSGRSSPVSNRSRGFSAGQSASPLGRNGGVNGGRSRSSPCCTWAPLLLILFVFVTMASLVVTFSGSHMWRPLLGISPDREPAVEERVGLRDDLASEEELVKGVGFEGREMKAEGAMEAERGEDMDSNGSGGREDQGEKDEFEGEGKRWQLQNRKSAEVDEASESKDDGREGGALVGTAEFATIAKGNLRTNADAFGLGDGTGGYSKRAAEGEEVDEEGGREGAGKIPGRGWVADEKRQSDVFQRRASENPGVSGRQSRGNPFGETEASVTGLTGAELGELDGLRETGKRAGSTQNVQAAEEDGLDEGAGDHTGSKWSLVRQRRRGRDADSSEETGGTIRLAEKQEDAPAMGEKDGLEEGSSADRAARYEGGGVNNNGEVARAEEDEEEGEGKTVGARKRESESTGGMAREEGEDRGEDERKADAEYDRAATSRNLPRGETGEERDVGVAQRFQEGRDADMGNAASEREESSVRPGHGLEESAIEEGETGREGSIDDAAETITGANEEGEKESQEFAEGGLVRARGRETRRGSGRQIEVEKEQDTALPGEGREGSKDGFKEEESEGGGRDELVGIDSRLDEGTDSGKGGEEGEGGRDGERTEDRQKGRDRTGDTEAEIEEEAGGTVRGTGFREPRRRSGMPSGEDKAADSAAGETDLLKDRRWASRGNRGTGEEAAEGDEEGTSKGQEEAEGSVKDAEAAAFGGSVQEGSKAASQEFDGREEKTEGDEGGAAGLEGRNDLVDGLDLVRAEERRPSRGMETEEGEGGQGEARGKRSPEEGLSKREEGEEREGDLDSESKGGFLPTQGETIHGVGKASSVLEERKTESEEGTAEGEERPVNLLNPKGLLQGIEGTERVDAGEGGDAQAEEAERKSLGRKGRPGWNDGALSGSKGDSVSGAGRREEPEDEEADEGQLARLSTRPSSALTRTSQTDDDPEGTATSSASSLTSSPVKAGERAEVDEGEEGDRVAKTASEIRKSSFLKGDFGLTSEELGGRSGAKGPQAVVSPVMEPAEPRVPRVDLKKAVADALRSGEELELDEPGEDEGSKSTASPENSAGTGRLARGEGGAEVGDGSKDGEENVTSGPGSISRSDVPKVTGQLKTVDEEEKVAESGTSSPLLSETTAKMPQKSAGEEAEEAENVAGDRATMTESVAKGVSTSPSKSAVAESSGREKERDDTAEVTAPQSTRWEKAAEKEEIEEGKEEGKEEEKEGKEGKEEEERKEEGKEEEKEGKEEESEGEADGGKKTTKEGKSSAEKEAADEEPPVLAGMQTPSSTKRSTEGAASGSSARPTDDADEGEGVSGKAATEDEDEAEERPQASKSGNETGKGKGKGKGNAPAVAGKGKSEDPQINSENDEGKASVVADEGEPDHTREKDVDTDLNGADAEQAGSTKAEADEAGADGEESGGKPKIAASNSSLPLPATAKRAKDGVEADEGPVESDSVLPASREDGGAEGREDAAVAAKILKESNSTTGIGTEVPAAELPVLTGKAIEEDATEATDEAEDAKTLVKTGMQSGAGQKAVKSERSGDSLEDETNAEWEGKEEGKGEEKGGGEVTKDSAGPQTEGGGVEELSGAKEGKKDLQKLDSKAAGKEETETEEEEEDSKSQAATLKNQAVKVVRGTSSESEESEEGDGKGQGKSEEGKGGDGVDAKDEGGGEDGEELPKSNKFAPKKAKSASEGPTLADRKGKAGLPGKADSASRKAAEDKTESEDQSEDSAPAKLADDEAESEDQAESTRTGALNGKKSSAIPKEEASSLGGSEEPSSTTEEGKRTSAKAGEVADGGDALEDVAASSAASAAFPARKAAAEPTHSAKASSPPSAEAEEASDEGTVLEGNADLSKSTAGSPPDRPLSPPTAAGKGGEAGEELPKDSAIGGEAERAKTVSEGPGVVAAEAGAKGKKGGKGAKKGKRSKNTAKKDVKGSGAASSTPSASSAASVSSASAASDVGKAAAGSLEKSAKGKKAGSMLDLADAILTETNGTDIASAATAGESAEETEAVKKHRRLLVSEDSGKASGNPHDSTALQAIRSVLLLLAKQVSQSLSSLPLASEVAASHSMLSSLPATSSSSSSSSLSMSSQKASFSLPASSSTRSFSGSLLSSTSKEVSLDALSNIEAQQHFPHLSASGKFPDSVTEFSHEGSSHKVPVPLTNPRKTQSSSKAVEKKSQGGVKDSEKHKSHPSSSRKSTSHNLSVLELRKAPRRAGAERKWDGG